MARILLVDDEPSVLSVLSNLMKGKGFEIQPCLGGEKAMDLLNKQGFDLMITDIRMEPVDGMELLRAAKSQHPYMSVIVLSAVGSVETAVEAMKEGAFDYATKPFKVDELMLTVQRALEYRRALHENEELKAQLSFRSGLNDVVAESDAMRKICTMIERVAPTDQTVIIGGESGVGKEVIAKAIHNNSIRKNEAFVPINCAALPEPLLESELFGHVKGSFTGASTDKEGLFEVASGGTIFLDEIGAMPMSLQSKLLRVLQENEIRRVGGTKQIKVDPRVVAATNDDLEKLIKEGKFREDLYYRLSVIPLTIAPLRERVEDILPLARFFVKNISDKAGVPIPEMSPDVQIALETYRWPGNVRELENAIRHACTFATDGVLNSEDLPARVLARSQASVTSGTGTGFATQEYLGRSLKGFLREVEKDYILRTIEEHHGDKDAAARSLQVSLATLYRKLPDPG
jgi:DNA-binding NtrC family response regulator